MLTLLNSKLNHLFGHLLFIQEPTSMAGISLTSHTEVVKGMTLPICMLILKLPYFISEPLYSPVADGQTLENQQGQVWLS